MLDIQGCSNRPSHVDQRNRAHDWATHVDLSARSSRHPGMLKSSAADYVLALDRNIQGKHRRDTSVTFVKLPAHMCLRGNLRAGGHFDFQQ